MNKNNGILIELDETAMNFVEKIANVLDVPIEEMAEDALLAYASSIEKRMKIESRKIFNS